MPEAIDEFTGIFLLSFMERNFVKEILVNLQSWKCLYTINLYALEDLGLVRSFSFEYTGAFPHEQEERSFMFGHMGSHLLHY